mmetsp:Transcript_35674/g.65422  ORF Transcript_35674/g.65422 Transcript_35674/m.65422 type:complete len:380 (+) Transcript_35674:76-1215(+)
MIRDDDIVSDRNYDVAIPVETDDEVETPQSSAPNSPASAQKSPGQPKPVANQGRGGGGGVGGGGGGGGRKVNPNDDDSQSEGSSSSEESSTSETSDEETEKKGGATGMAANQYNPDDYKGMKVSDEVNELFQHITRYKPHTIDLETSLKPFIPELIPSIGEVDAFLKMPRPDGKASDLGAARLDEPTLNPSDPSILDLQLRSLSKKQDLQPMEVRSIENSDKCPKEIENWIKRIDDLNRSKPAANVQYTKRMPDIETLMQVWPGEFEEFLQNSPLPDMEDLDLDLKTYIKVIAGILDVPVHDQITEALHVIFTLYSEFKSNQHFSKTDNGGAFGANDPYNFGTVPNFAAGPPAAAGTAPFGGHESLAPSRAPSPAGQKG